VQMQRQRRFIAVLAATAGLTVPGKVHAYCISVASAQTKEDGAFEAKGTCFGPKDAVPLYWSARDVNYEVQVDPALNEFLSLDDARGLVQRAALKWQSVTCANGASPRIKLIDKTGDDSASKPLSPLSPVGGCVPGKTPFTGNVIRFTNERNTGTPGLTCPLHAAADAKGKQNGKLLF
jgi:hypothetical protein